MKVKPIKPIDKRKRDPEEEKKEELPDLPNPDKFDKVWVFPFFAKPGNHNYMIKFKNTQEPKQAMLLKKIKKY
jgi:hypothetical protein